MKTKEVCKNEIARINNFDSFEKAIRYTFNRKLLESEKDFFNKIIDEAMEEYASQKQVSKEKLLTDFYMWMVENDYDHNIRSRVEKKAKIFLFELASEQLQPEQDEDNALDKWWRELTKRQIDFILLKIG